MERMARCRPRNLGHNRIGVLKKLPPPKNLFGSDSDFLHERPKLLSLFYIENIKKFILAMVFCHGLTSLRRWSNAKRPLGRRRMRLSDKVLNEVHKVYAYV
jgi:hypothetical protein